MCSCLINAVAVAVVVEIKCIGCWCCCSPLSNNCVVCDGYDGLGILPNGTVDVTISCGGLGKGHL